MAFELSNPFPTFTDLNGEPLENGKIFIGKINLNPETNPVPVFFDGALTIPAVQPIRTIAGYPSRDGTPGQLFVSDIDLSITVRDKNDKLVFSNLDANAVLKLALIDASTLANVAAMTALLKTNLTDGVEVNVSGYITQGNGGGNRFFFDATSTVTANPITFIATDEGGDGRWRPLTDDVINVLMAGTPIDGITDGSTEIQATIDSITTAASTIERGAIQFPVITNNYVINTQLELDKKNIDFIGNNNALKWEGNNTSAMIRVTDSTRCHFENLILLGNLTTPPTAALFFEGIAPGSVGTNENMVIDGCILGRRFQTDTTTGGSSDATPAGRLQSGIVIGGLDGNNDEYAISNTQVHNCDDIAIDFRNVNSIWSLISNTLMNDSGIGLQTGANLTAINIVFNRNTTVDIKGVRPTNVWIFGMNAENSKTFIESNAGASYYLTGGKLLRNDAVASFFFNWTSGGDMVLRNLLVLNPGGTGDTVRYRGASSGGICKVSDSVIDGGDNRDTWDISTGTLTVGLNIPIDIEHGLFKFKTTFPYIDVAVVMPSVPATGRAVVGSGGVSVPFDEFFHVAYQFDYQAQHITVAIDSATQIRGHIFNPTAGTIDLTDGRLRWMNLGDHVVASASDTIDIPSMTDGTGQTVTLSVPGVRLGDYVAYSVGSSFLNIFLTAYVSADDTVSLRAHNATGGINNPGPTLFFAAKIAEFGNFQNGIVHTPAPIANTVSTSLTVTVPGAQLGAHVFVAYTKDLKGLIVTAHVSAVDTVKIVQTNFTGGSVTLAAGSFKVMVAF